MFSKNFIHQLGTRQLLSCIWLWSAAATSLVAAHMDAELNRQAVSLLRRECFSCHGPDKQEAELRLDSSEAILAGGENGKVIERPNVDLAVQRTSLLLERIEHSDESLLMPPKRRLGETDIAILRAWIQAGAGWPAQDESNSMSDLQTGSIGDAWSDPRNPIRRLFQGGRLDLWSLKPIGRPAIPVVKDMDWCRNPIDRFVLAKWEGEGRSPAAESPESVLVRRVAMDLNGLPSDFTQVQSFVQDSDPGKWDRLIEQKLSSPNFGVHWARMWLDVVRYSDSNGFDWDEFRPNVWRYRDYVVRALNRDESFDRFIEKQLAGDELFDGAPRDGDEQDNLIASSYLRLGPRDNAAGLFNEQDRARAELMSDLTETTASAFLGLTMSCCRCHDHKTDPLSHADHYRLRAFFAASHYADDLPVDLKEEQTTISEHNQKIDEKIAAFQKSILKIVDVVLQRQPSKVDAAKAKDLMNAEERDQVKQADTEIQSLKRAKRHFTTGLAMQDNAKSIQPTHILMGGDHKAPREIVGPGFPSVLFPNTPTMVKPIKGTSTGRRLTLARWIASADNPWTARVIVNRIWQSYFGQGIVATPNDFGVTGALPTHPELLDYLAMELIESGWSLKHIHRLIVTSSTYRQQALAEVEKKEGSGIATLRTYLRRKSAEQLRDSVLHVSGLLQEKSGGPPIWPELDEATLAANPAVLDDNETKTKGWYPSPASSQSVRSLYLIQKRTIRIPWLETFDLPENAVSCGRRECSLVAPQSLAMMNGSLALQAATQTAETISKRMHGNKQQTIEEAFRTILSRNPRGDELSSCELFLESRTLVELCLVLLNTNEFAFIE